MADALDELLAVAIVVLHQGVLGNLKQIPELELLSSQVAGPMPRRSITPGGMERLGGYLSACIEVATTPLDRQLAEALDAAADQLYWTSPYDKVERGPQLEALNSRYVCTVLAGQEAFREYQAPFVCEDSFIAFTLQFPHTFYPAHSHYAREVYHVVAGQSDWQFGEEWISRQPGDWIFHPSYLHHAMQTTDEPLLSMVSWIDGFDNPEVHIHED